MLRVVSSGWVSAVHGSFGLDDRASRAPWGRRVSPRARAPGRGGDGSVVDAGEAPGRVPGDGVFVDAEGAALVVVVDPGFVVCSADRGQAVGGVPCVGHRARGPVFTDASALWVVGVARRPFGAGARAELTCGVVGEGLFGGVGVAGARRLRDAARLVPFVQGVLTRGGDGGELACGVVGVRGRRPVDVHLGEAAVLVV